jgi:hypothetical protein
MDLLGQFEHAANLGLFELCFLSGAGVALLAGYFAIRRQRRSGTTLLANTVFGLIAGYFAVQGIRYNFPIGIGLSGLSCVHLYTVSALLGIRAPRPDATHRAGS